MKQKNSPIFISAGGRSGSTWVQDALGKANGLRTVFEPLHPERIPRAGSFAYKYIPDDREEPELKKILDEVIWGRRGRLWANYRINRQHFWHGRQAVSSFSKARRQQAKYLQMARRYFRYRRQSPEQRPVVKLIRANMMLGWLHKTYAAPILVLLRHPGAVVESKMRLWQGGWRYDELISYFDDQRLLADYWPELEVPDINRMSRAECFATVWCMETLVALDKVRRYGLSMTCYEHLLQFQHKEWQRLATELGLANIPEGPWLRQPSQQTSPQRKKSTFDQGSMGDWMKRMTAEDRQMVGETLQRFGITIYSMNSPLPAVAPGRPGPDPEGAADSDCQPEQEGRP